MDLFRFAILFKFGAVRVLTNVSKERSRSRSRGQKKLARRDRSVQEVVGVARDDPKLRNVGLQLEEECVITNCLENEFKCFQVSFLNTLMLQDTECSLLIAQC